MTMPKLMQLAKDNAARKSTLRAEAGSGASADELTIYVDGVIGDWFGDVGNAELKAALAGSKAKVIHLRVNTPGGDVFEARAMMTTLSQYGADKIVGHADALVASAGTFLMMVCDEIEMTQGGFFMIHNAWTIAMGNKNDMASTGELLAKIDDSIANDYMSRTNATRDQVTAWMDAETWMSADEAKANGFVDTVVEVTAKKKNQASGAWNLAAYANAPKALTDPPAEPDAIDPVAIKAHHEHLGRRLALLETAQA